MQKHTLTLSYHILATQLLAHLKWWISLSAVLLVTVPSNAQERCGTVPYQKMLFEQGTYHEQKDQFEEWIRDKIENRKVPFDTKQRQQATYQIPVVVHIIHNGEPVGTGVNISDEQILSQISVLNKDYKRLNTDAANTPAEFVPVAGSIDLEFVMARRTPEGIPTDGIVRVEGTRSEWELIHQYELKSMSYWPAEDYLNIWVTNLNVSYVGFAQFPVSNLPGLENSSTNRLTDGVVIHYQAFGSIEDGAFDLDNNYNLGRTSTHEIGHFLGLRHIWGDEDPNGSCSATDYVDDTPTQETSTSGCPNTVRVSCGSNDMYMNYLDYTDDACMNLFTEDQVGRMMVVLANSPRRNSLLTSPALTDPVPLANDLAIQSVISPTGAECNNTIVPQLSLLNVGNNAVTSTTFQLLDNNVLIDSYDFVLALDPDESTTMTFPALNLPSGPHEFTFEIALANGVADANPGNNVRIKNFQIPFFTSAPFLETFEILPSDWLITNPDGWIGWERASAPFSLPGNQAMKMNFFDYENSQGELDVLSTPVFDLSTSPTAYVSFDIAYAQFQNYDDGLRVYVLTECNSIVFNGDLVYEKFGSNLATAPATGAPFVPSTANDWRKEIVDLSAYVGESAVQLAFVGVNDWGNNLYLDNVAVITTADEDLFLKSVRKPSPVSCSATVAPELRIANTGTVTINSFNVGITVNNNALEPFAVSTPIAPGEEIVITLPQTTLPAEENFLTFTLANPNGLVDVNPEDNVAAMTAIVNDATRQIPFRQDFEGSFDGEWTLVNPPTQEPLATASTNFGRSIVFDGYEYPLPGQQGWLVSPVLDLATTEKASVFFDLSHAYNPGLNDRLQVLGSTDCGQTYPIPLLDLSGEELAVTTSSSPWFPSSDDQWQRIYINLNELGRYPEGRIAFVITTAGGNNLFLDNVEFFASDDPAPPRIEKQFLLYGTEPSQPGHFYLTFNLDEPQPVLYEILDVMGRQIVGATLENVLNQTFLIDAGPVAAGIYLVRLQIGGDYYVTKIFLTGS